MAKRRPKERTPGGKSTDDDDRTDSKLTRLKVDLGAPVSDPEVERILRTVHACFLQKARAAGFSDTDLASIMHQIVVFAIPAGKHVILPNSFLAVVGTGVVKTTVRPGVVDPDRAPGSSSRKRGAGHQRITVQFAKPSYIIGLTSPAGGVRSRTFGAVAHVYSHVAVIGYDVISDLLGRTDSNGRLKVFAYHCRALSRLIATKAHLLSLNARDRLRIELVGLARELPLDAHPGYISTLLSQQDLAEAIGTDRSCVAKGIRKLAEEGVAHYDREMRRYAINPALLVPAPSISNRSVGARGLHADESERTHFAKSLHWATRQVGLPRELVRLLIEGAELWAYPPGETIAVDDRLYATVLVSGAARVLVEVRPGCEVGVWIAKPGHFIGAGWIGNAGEFVPSFRAVAHDTGSSQYCTVAVLREDLLLKLTEALTPPQLLRLLGYIHDALSRQLFDRCAVLPLGTAARLLYQLHVLAADFPTPTPDGTAIAIPLDFSRDLAPLVAAKAGAVKRARRSLIRARRIRILEDDRVLVVGFFLQKSTG